MTRIYKDRVDLDPSDVRRFFEHRGSKIKSEHPLTSVLYQDCNPELAEARDAFEKETVLPLLDIADDAEVLDIGCGIGRWADALHGRVARYHGVDISDSLITAARQRIHDPLFTFQHLPAEDVTPQALHVAAGFSHIIIAGVLLYMNDDQLEQTLRAANLCCRREATIYLREPVAEPDRLTLKQYPSDELNAEYNAIYRTEAELIDCFRACLEAHEFKLVHKGPLYPDQLNNRRETRQNIFVLRRS
jgi:2-polyprenyl-3-methyl-5-hydroxy-6-metoxy-1,4-benzoquinol methylase